MDVPVLAAHITIAVGPFTVLPGTSFVATGLNQRRPAGDAFGSYGLDSSGLDADGSGQVRCSGRGVRTSV